MGENVEQGRNADILQSIIDSTEYTDPPQSRIEDLLLQVKEAIEEGGGGGGDVTSVNGKTGAVTLTASDVGAYTTAETDALLGDKQSKTMSASVKIGTETETTVEGAIGEVAAIIPATAATSNKLSTAADTAKEDITATANSEDIALTDSTDARVHDLKIYGKTVDGHSVGENGLTVSAGGGYNIWDEEWEVGSYSAATGEKVENQYRLRCKNLIPVDPNFNYWVTTTKDVSLNINGYDKNGVFVGQLSSNGSIRNALIPNIRRYNVSYIAFWTYSTTEAQIPYNYGITINKSNGIINGQYFPYQKTNMPISTALPLRGSYKTVDLGSLNWYYETSVALSDDPASMPRFATNANTVPDAYIPSVEFGVAMSSCSSRFTPAIDPVLGGNTDKTICFGKGKGVYIVDHDYTDAAAFKAAVTGITLTYPSYCDEIDLADGVAITRLDSNGDVLATPVTTPLSDAEKAAFAEFRTFDDNTNITATDNPFMTLNYVRNTDNGKALADVDNKSAVRMAMIAAPYDGTATYAVGDYCTYGDRLWKCNTAIGTAEPFTAGHWTATTVMEEI